MFAGTRRSRRRKRSPAPVQDSGLGSAVALLSTGATSIAFKTILMMMMLLMMTMMSKFSAWSSLSQPGRVLWREPWRATGWSRGGSSCRLGVFVCMVCTCTLCKICTLYRICTLCKICTMYRICKLFKICTLHITINNTENNHIAKKKRDALGGETQARIF